MKELHDEVPVLGTAPQSWPATGLGPSFLPSTGTVLLSIPTAFIQPPDPHAEVSAAVTAAGCPPGLRAGVRW